MLFPPPADDDSHDITLFLHRAAEGDPEAERRLISLIYSTLRKQAAYARRNERPSHTLQATEIAHEAYLRLMRGKSGIFVDRAHFFKTAARTMRRILVDHARKRKAQRRGGLSVAVPLEENMIVSEDEADRVLQVDEAIKRLSHVAERSAVVVEMRFFAGLTEEEIGGCLGLSLKTVKRDWKLAKEFFQEELPL